MEQFMDKYFAFIFTTAIVATLSVFVVSVIASLIR